MLKLLRNAVKQLTLKRAALALIVLPLLIYLYGEAIRDPLIIDPFAVPKHFEEIGLTPDVMGHRIADALRKLEEDTKTHMRKDELSAWHDEMSTPDIAIPGTRLGLKTIVEVTRAVFRIYPRHVSGDIVVQAPPTSEPASRQVRITIRITHGRDRGETMTITAPDNDVDLLAARTAEMILSKVNPYVLACYWRERKEIARAAAIARQISQDTSQDRRHRAAAYGLLGNIIAEQEKYDEAIAQYQKAVELDPKLAFVYVTWGVALDQEGKPNEAIAKFQKATEIDPKFVFAYTYWGTALSGQGKHNEAMAKFEKAVRLDPKNAIAYVTWGVALSGQGKPNEAITKFQKAIEIDPRVANAYTFWGVVLYQEGKHGEAVAKLQKAIELDSNVALTYITWGAVLDEEGKPNEAIAKFQKATEIDPKIAMTYDYWARALAHLGRYVEARQKLALARSFAQSKRLMNGMGSHR